MDTKTGRILPSETIEQIRRAMAGPEELRQFQKRYKKMYIRPTPTQMARHPPRIRMYDLCPCGSGKKFKWCCYTGSKGAKR